MHVVQTVYHDGLIPKECMNWLNVQLKCNESCFG